MPCFQHLYRVLALSMVCTVVAPSEAYSELPFPLKAKRIVFLGDSITHAGGYISWIETQLRLKGVDPMPELINLGLASETVSGLSEPGHPFPRPNVHDRLDKALEKLKPDVVVACYGMNDGIYHPFSKKRFQTFQDGVNLLIQKVHQADARLVLITPPPFDPVPLQGKKTLQPATSNRFAYFAIYENYDAEVISRYAQWVMQQKDRVAMVIDVHTPITAFLKEKRKQNPKFKMAGDGVHLNAEGHRLLGDTILTALAIRSSPQTDLQLFKLVSQKNKLLHDAWLSEVGHKRPGVKKMPAHQRSPGQSQTVGCENPASS